MNGISLNLDDKGEHLILHIDPQTCGDKLESKSVQYNIYQSEYKDLYLDDQALISAVELAIKRNQSGNDSQVEMAIAQILDGKLLIDVSPDEMEVELTVYNPYGGRSVTLEEVNEALKDQKVSRGISKKRIEKLLKELSAHPPGKSLSEVIAKGLPPRKGKDSKIIPMVPNALDRILQPQNSGKDKVDMRNLGDIVCVNEGQLVAKKIPPRPGRNGYTVKNKLIIASEGDWVQHSLGTNTKCLDDDPNLIIATVSGQPKFKYGQMNIDDVYRINGVNVKTGNVDYDGAVIVNGDVTENMKIIATGDVTINGFVESAYIKTQGDIIITQGATGKPNRDECRLEAGGSIALFHAQNTKMQAHKDVRVMKQLSHSEIDCEGEVIVGNQGKIDGNLFGCRIRASGQVAAGKIGAISGSKLEIDYSEAYNKLYYKHESLMELRKVLESSNATHEIRFVKLKRKKHRDALLPKVRELGEKLQDERSLLNWLRRTEQNVEAQLKEFKKKVQVSAYENIFPGVEVRINKQSFNVDKDYKQVIVSYQSGEWRLEALKT
ncbi:DUF342 domain-containing protein [Glaciecola sp. 1036]|uniref:DUF342 domain-containing protein n=1 Tax=Alteromonadaceae TaxID=72275 RepID=UPI003CFDEA8C